MLFEVLCFDIPIPEYWCGRCKKKLTDKYPRLKNHEAQKKLMHSRQRRRVHVIRSAETIFLLPFEGMQELLSILQLGLTVNHYLDWQLNVKPNVLREFEAKLCRDFKGIGPYPLDSLLPFPALTPMPSTMPYGASMQVLPLMQQYTWTAHLTALYHSFYCPQYSVI